MINKVQSQAITEDAIAIDKKKIQLETVAVVESGQNENIHWTFPSILLRYGVQSNIELRLTTAMEGGHNVHQQKTNTFENVELGVKLHLLKNKIANLSVISHIIFPTNTEKLLNNEVNAITSVIASLDMSKKFQLGGAIHYNFEEFAQRSIDYSILIYYIFSKEWNIHLENFGALREERNKIVNLGIDWQFKKNLQWQISLGTKLKQEYNYISAGMVWQVN